MTRPMTRRSFVAVGAAGVAAPLFVPSSLLGRLGAPGPNERIGLGFIGMGKRAHELLGPVLGRPDCRVVAVCDVDTTRREHAKAEVERRQGAGTCKAFLDYRDLLASPDVDAVVIATPDHWHALQTVHAAQAGKDIYCEKPLSTTLHEAKVMVDAVRASGRVFQTGSQQRTEFNHIFVTACEYARAGRIGDLLTVHVGVGTSSTWCDLPAEDPEPGLDWDRWLGPAPMRSYNSTLAPRGIIRHYPAWRNFREYAGGGLTDIGAHNFDIAQWGINADQTGPVRVVLRDPASPYGAKLVYASGIEVYHGGPFGITFTGTRGQIHVWRDRISSIEPEILKTPLTDADPRLPRHPDHFSNFIDCVRSRERCICDVEVGARAAACAHLCNAAYWNGSSLEWDPVAWKFTDARANATLLDRERRPAYQL